MRIGVIGYGAWGKLHARALHGLPGVRLAALLCYGNASAAQAAADFPGVPVHRGLEGFLAAPIDAVDIVAPNHLHAPLALAAIASGRHVLVEKPLATTAGDCDRIAAATRAAGVLISVGHELRVSAQWGRIKREIEQGAIGIPMFATYGLFRRPFRPGAGGWRRDRDRVGSWILEEPVHFFDLLQWYFAGHGLPATLRADGAGGGGLDANLVATMRYGSGASFTVSQTLSGFGHHCTLDIAGTEGALRAWWSGEDARTTAPVAGLSILRRGEAAPETLEFPHSGEVFELTEHLRASVEAFRQGRSPLDAEEARKSVVLCLAAERACRTGETVDLDWG